MFRGSSGLCCFENLPLVFFGHFLTYFYQGGSQEGQDQGGDQGAGGADQDHPCQYEQTGGQGGQVERPAGGAAQHQAGPPVAEAAGSGGAGGQGGDEAVGEGWAGRARPGS